VGSFVGFFQKMASVGFFFLGEGGGFLFGFSSYFSEKEFLGCCSGFLFGIIQMITLWLSFSQY